MRTSVQERFRLTLAALFILFASILTMGILLAPFFFPGSILNQSMMLNMVVLFVCLAFLMTILDSLQTQATKMTAILGMLIALNTVLRWIQLPAGFSLAFFLPIVVGYTFGPVAGFLLGALSIFLSSLLGLGMGPWVIYQMMLTGLVGGFSGFMPKIRGSRLNSFAILVLAIWGGASGIVYGFLINLWFWPEMNPSTYTESGTTSHFHLISMYLSFYFTTSFIWDLTRSLGNIFLIALFGMPCLRILERHRKRFSYSIN